MARLAASWRSMPRPKQVLAGIAAFWLLYAIAFVYEWPFDGPADPAGIQSGSSAVTTTVTTGDDATTPPHGSGRTPTAGDLLVVLAAGFIAISLGATGLILWRESRGPGREPGMGAGDDPLWSSGDQGRGSGDLSWLETRPRA